MQPPAVPAPARIRRLLSRRALLTAAATGASAPFLSRPFWARPARAADIIWRIGHSAPTHFPLHIRLIEAAGLIAARSGGRMQLQVFANNELGSPIGMMAQVRAGTAQAVPLTSQMLAVSLPVFGLPMVGFAFADYQAVWTAMDGGIGAYLRGQAKDRLGLIAMPRCWNFGFRQITTSNRPIVTAADLNGLKLRTPPEADFIGLFQALSALPVAMPLGSVEGALQSRAIDGQEGLLQLVTAASLYRAQSFCSLTNHVWDGQWICVAGKAWADLPPSLQDIVQAAFDEAGAHQRQDTMTAEDQTRAGLEAKGMKFNAVEPERFRQALRKTDYYAAWHKKIGEAGWAALEKHAGRLA